MSWMDSWSRPNKSSATPPPYYLTQPDVKYCSTCGRVIGARRSTKKNNVVKYCSDGCRKHRPGPIDKKIDKAILALLQGQEDSGIEKTNAKAKFRKGDKRIFVTCDEIESIVFNREKSAEGHHDESEPELDEEGISYGRIVEGQQSDDATGAISADEHTAGEDTGDEAGAPLSEAQRKADATDQHQASLDDKRAAGQKRANEREMVRRAARRAVVFGLPMDQADPKKDNTTNGDADTTPRRKAEALSNGNLVEPSFAKGNWGIRWRDD